MMDDHCCRLNSMGLCCDCDPCGLCSDRPSNQPAPMRRAVLWACALALTILLGGRAVLWASAIALAILLGGGLLEVISTLITHGAQR